MIMAKLTALVTSGDPIFERAFRVHMNTIEQLVVFLPVLWLSVQVIGDAWTGLAGVVWLAGRVIYASGYMKDPTKRGPGMLITLSATLVLIVVTLVGIARGFLAA